MPNLFKAPSLAALTLAILAGCATGPGEPRQPEPEGLDERVSTLLNAAKSQPAAERQRTLLEAVALLQAQGDTGWAGDLLQSLDPDTMGDELYVRYLRLYSENAIEQGRYFDAQDALNTERLDELWSGLTRERRRDLLARQAQVSSLLGDYHQSLQSRDQLSQLLDTPSERQSNNEAIWQDLMGLTTTELDSMQTHSPSRTLRGWAELALLARNNASNLRVQLNQVEQWRERWRSHPAARSLPNDLELLSELIAQQPKQVALLLPQTGRLAGAASAVRDGFLAAYYAGRSAEATPIIREYDTSEADIRTVYQRAVDDGAELIVGPLAKDKVSELATLESQSVPVLALNYAATETDPSPLDRALAFSVEDPITQLAEQTAQTLTEGDKQGLFEPALYQFGLAAEDEARQIARHAHLEGYHRAMVISPDRDWAQRSVDAFSDQWQALDGQLVAFSRFVGAGDYSRVIKNALLIDESEERHDQLRQIIYTNTHFEPRRRQDVDVIFLIANPAQARQIKPTLAFHYAGHLPVFATSQIYTGESNPKADRDLNGIRFNTLPWLFDNESPEKRAIRQYADTPAAYRRLNALGVDAYHLYPRLPQLQRVPQARLFGATGTLSINEDGRVKREQIWAQFKNGEARPIVGAAIERAERDQ